MFSCSLGIVSILRLGRDTCLHGIGIGIGELKKAHP